MQVGTTLFKIDYDIHGNFTYERSWKHHSITILSISFIVSMGKIPSLHFFIKVLYLILLFSVL